MKKVRDGFVPVAELDKQINRFLNKYGQTLGTETDKIAYYCQMTAYNAYVGYYRDELGWNAEVRQSKKRRFEYKLQPTGNPAKFSFFELTKGKSVIWLLNNMQVESAHNDWRFFAPDVVAVRPNCIKSHKAETARAGGYERTVYSIKNRDLITFAEIKNVAPFPELLFSFQGILFELMPEIFFGKVKSDAPEHPAPALLCSFAGSRQSALVLSTLQDRYHVNILARFLAFKKLPDTLRLIPLKRTRPSSGSWLKRRKASVVASQEE